MGTFHREIEALKEECFGSHYREFPEVANNFLRLLSHVLLNQHEQGWHVGGEFRVVMTAHAVRLLHRMGVSLTDRWNLDVHRSQKGNLLRAIRMIVDAHRTPTADRWSHWDEDLWDDCYVLLALYEVKDDLKRADAALHSDFEDTATESLPWLERQVLNQFESVPSASEWRGPGFAAAAMELFSHRNVSVRLSDEDALWNNLTEVCRRMLEDEYGKASWHSAFAWHAGQMVTAWKRYRSTRPVLRSVDAAVSATYKRLLELQHSEGGWPDPAGHLRTAQANYATSRALSACYLMEESPSRSPTVKAAHGYVIKESQRHATPLGNLKACLNMLEAHQELFGFRCSLANANLHLLISLLERLERMGLFPVVVSDEEPEPERALARVRQVAKRRLENAGRSALEPFGVNDRLYEDLRNRSEFLNEFAGEASGTKKVLRRFLSATMTETRSDLARALIKSLWAPSGFLNFLPFLERLSDLEHQRAFYSKYRDHINHQVLFFLLGSYTYFNCPRVREAIDREIGRYDAARGLAPRPLPEEFLFRWKLIATFHDVGYLFEVDPATDGDLLSRSRSKEELIDDSLKGLEQFRKEFTERYLAYTGMDLVTSRKLLERLPVSEYPSPVQTVDSLFALADGKDAFELIGDFIQTPRIHRRLVRRYFDMCREQRSKRAPFLDHGIMSALMLLKTIDIQRHYLSQLTQLAAKGELRSAEYRKLLDIVADAKTVEHLHPGFFFARFGHVASAMALHNIYPRLHAQDICNDYELGESFYGPHDQRYGISIDESALAFLTALTDALQDWDRHSYKRPTIGEPEERPISAADLVIEARRGTLHLQPLTDEARRRMNRNYEQMRDYLIGISDVLVLD